MKKYLYLLIATGIFASCSKREPKVTSTIVIGRVIDSTTSQNIPNTAFVMYSAGVNGYSSGPRSVPFSTDSTGRFLVVFDVEESSPISICWPNGLSGPYTYNPRYEIVEKPAPKGEYPFGLDFGNIYTKL